MVEMKHPFNSINQLTLQLCNFSGKAKCNKTGRCAIRQQQACSTQEQEKAWKDCKPVYLSKGEVKWEKYTRK